MDCEATRENVDAWALGALDARDAQAVEGHIASCAACAELADEAREVAAAIALAVPLRSPSATLKPHIMASAAVLTDIRAGRPARWWMAGAAAVLAIGVGAIAWAWVTQARINDLEDRNAVIIAGATAASSERQELATTVETQDAIIDVMLAPDAERTDLVGTAGAPVASGRCVWSRAEAKGALLVSGLEPAPEGSTYTMWIVYENEWLDAGSFAVDETGQGRLLMTSWRSTNPERGAFGGFAVTVEPAGGSGTQHGAPVMESVRAD